MNLVEEARKAGEERGATVARNIVDATVRATLIAALNKNDGFVSEAAKALGINSRELVKLIKEHDLVATWKQRERRIVCEKD